MIIKRHITFRLRSYGNKGAQQIRVHVTFCGNRIMLTTGCQISSADAWDEENELVRPGYRGPKGESDATINNKLRNVQDQMDTVFKYFEVNEIKPSSSQVVAKYNERMKGTEPKKEDVVHEKKPRGTNFWSVFDRFDKECGAKNAWTESTHEKMAALKEDLTSFKKDLRFKDLDESGLTAFVTYLRDQKRLRTPRKKKGERKEYDKEDITGLKNSTIKKKLEFLSWFMNWATDHGYNTNMSYRSFHPTLKETQKKVIYLTKPELEKIKQLVIPSGDSHLEAVRDVFLFCCFSGLRHSDAYNLKRNDVKGDRIEVTTIKTADSIIVELNSVTKEILDKYKDYDFGDNKALPVIQNQPMNRELKDLCKLAGINEKIRITTYKGNERTDEIKEKWELVGTHTGRRTFIVNCLSLGIAPNVVMKWTGHSSYSAMQPYIDIVDSIKANEMKKLDSLL